MHALQKRKSDLSHFQEVNCPRNVAFTMKRVHMCKQLPQSGCQDSSVHCTLIHGKLCVHNLLCESTKMDKIALKTVPALLALSPPVSGIQMQLGSGGRSKSRRISQFFISLILEIPAGPRFHLTVLKMSFSDPDAISIQDIGRQS